jgi:hypothetical protein
MGCERISISAPVVHDDLRSAALRIDLEGDLQAARRERRPARLVDAFPLESPTDRSNHQPVYDGV